MKLAFTFNMGADARRAIGHRLYGDGRLASREEVRSWIAGTVRADLDILAAEHNAEAERNLSAHLAECRHPAWVRRREATS